MFNVDWFSQNIPNWTKWLAEFKGKPNLIFLEIGCFEGKATVWLLENILTDKSSIIETIDTFQGSSEYRESEKAVFKDMEKNFIENTKRFGRQVMTFVGQSGQILRRFEFDDYDFIYIDGSHKACDVLEDTILAWRLLKPNGIMIFDDYKWNRNEDPKLNPPMAIDAFLSIYEGQYELIAKEYQVCIRKKEVQE